MAERFRPPHKTTAVPKPRALAAISPARKAAYEILQRVGATSAHSDDLLHGPGLAGLSQPDKDLTTTLVLGVLRWQIALDARLQPLLSRPDLQVAEPVALALRMGAFQLLYLERIPAHAALNESVELVRAAGHAHAAGMVNAVLRSLLRTPAPRKPLVEPVATMAERLGHPLWLVQRWVKAYGRTAAEGICAFDQQEPRSGDPFGEADVSDSMPMPLPMPMMDAGSRLVAELAAASQPGAQHVWDCCAAPGGKTVVLGRRLPAAALLATDANPTRLRRLEQRLGRDLPGGRYEVRLADATCLPEDAGIFDLILCDVPCSGTGTLARNPEIRHRLEAKDLPRQAERQEKILRGALQRLARGGRLVYSTCSLEPEENAAVVRAVLEKDEAAGDVLVKSVSPLLQEMNATGLFKTDAGGLKGLVQGEFLRTLPGTGFQGDGFFAAVLERC